jgi:hypothetical protein
MTASDLSFRPTARARRAFLPTLLVALTVAATGAPVHEARAQGPASAPASQGDKTAAEALFGEGKRLMSEGKFAEACPKLAESNRIDPGAGTLTALALCHRGEGRTATAWSEFKEVISLARKDGRKDREEVASTNANELEPKLSRLKIQLDPAADQQGLTVKVDETVMNRAAFGSALPVDPGARRVTATAPLKKPFETTVNIGAERDEKSVQIHALEDDAEAIAQAEREKQEAAARANGDGPGTRKGNSTLRYAGYGLAGLGIVGIGVGSFFGVKALGKNSDAKDACPNTTCTNAAGVQSSKDAKSAATISNIAVGAGILAVAGGVVLVLVSGPSKSSTGYVTPTKSKTASTWHVMPSTDGRSSSVAISGSF